MVTTLEPCFVFQNEAGFFLMPKTPHPPTLLAQDPGAAAEPAREVLQEKETGFLLDRRENSVMYSRNSRRNERSWEPGEGSQCWIGGRWSNGGER